jgi:hypothetical protein
MALTTVWVSYYERLASVFVFGAALNGKLDVEKVLQNAIFGTNLVWPNGS